MIERDRELLARLQRFNAALGPAVMEMIHHQDGGELPADGLRELARQYRALADALDERAAEREADARTVESGPHEPCVEHGGAHCDTCEQPWPCAAARPMPMVRPVTEPITLRRLRR
ncbi:hypothetical protein [Prauserella muralis]|uniref:Uncharacterized protein n=1 Tax=Prauserella muralis TaxID=588067 RepID=A0A2V4B2S5_9PSEU|nr:hypothetical protein [Prauserella muralis]PXY27445.1 hypothetical protein BAY60_13510 [Prauserella muralis]TWE22854.1 hypothetical protein FHX69_4109 [Prauserella muralis]